jgi:hypothetical protein
MDDIRRTGDAEPGHASKKADPQDAKRRRLRILLFAIFGGLVLCAAIAHGTYYLLVGRYLASTDDAYTQADSTSISIAMLSTFTTIREHYHFAVISDRITRDNLLTQGRVADAAHAFAAKSGAALGHVQALGYIRNIVRRDAFVMAYSDCFFAMGVGLLPSILTLLAIPAAKGPAEPAG